MDLECTPWGNTKNMTYHLIGVITDYGSLHATDTHRPTTEFPPAFPALCYWYGDRHGNIGMEIMIANS